MLRQRIVALAMTRTHAPFENHLSELNAPTEPPHLAMAKINIKGGYFGDQWTAKDQNIYL